MYGAAGEPADGTGIPKTTPGSANIFSSDFDDETVNNNSLRDFGSSAVPLVNEGSTALGDSGGPLLVELGGEFLIAGVLSGGSIPVNGYGDISWHTAALIPEPSSTLALMTFGAVGIGISLYRRRQHSNSLL